MNNENLNLRLATLLYPRPPTPNLPDESAVEFVKRVWRTDKMWTESEYEPGHFLPALFLENDLVCFRAVDEMMRRGYRFHLSSRSCTDHAAMFIRETSYVEYATTRREALVKAMIKALEAK